MNRLAKRPNPASIGDQRGMSLLEVTLLLGVLVIVTAAVAPAMLRVVQGNQRAEVLAEMRALHGAMMGDEESQTFGFVGDLGRLPFEPSELVTRTSQPLFAIAEDSGVGYGWNGPYVNSGAGPEDYAEDAWGSRYDIGIVGPGQIRSAGPNGIFDDGDDLVFPPNSVNPYGSLVVTVKGHSGDLVDTDPEGCSATLSFAAEGIPQLVFDDSAPFSFFDVHRGLHRVEVSCQRFDGGIAAEATVVAMRGGSQQAVELHVELGVNPGADAANESEEPEQGSPVPSDSQG